MKTFLLLISATLSSAIFMIILIPILKNIAIKINLFDKPNSRKSHHYAIPLVGGIGIVLSIILAGVINPLITQSFIHLKILMLASLVLLIVGVIDDKHDIKAIYKLVIQLFCALAISLAGYRIQSLFGLFGYYEISIIPQYFLTILLITGVVNAFNLLDGVDGLLAVFSIIGCLVFLIISIHLKLFHFTALYLSIISGLIVFLKFNLQKDKIFMGDAGSLFFGNLIVGTAIFFMNHKGFELASRQLILNVFIGFLSVPVLDSFRVYLGRIKRGRSPFQADKTHLHHLLLLLGLSHKTTTVIIAALSISFLIFNLLVFEILNIVLVIFSLILIFSLLSYFLNLNKKVIDWSNKIKMLENKQF